MYPGASPVMSKKTPNPASCPDRTRTLEKIKVLLIAPARSFVTDPGGGDLPTNPFPGVCSRGRNPTAACSYGRNHVRQTAPSAMECRAKAKRTSL
ncbi:hypothetical protein GLE_1106 [Lysobacter enzymogenes]|uniref:Uncharacterized protein n=1 Tax=Lysobacter enzymogenes TaxID=69 RepID=A0A0S2DDC0_LYSEN|nr:hypothetical protein GLE_1106 [Lysobacter enzymogenes]